VLTTADEHHGDDHKDHDDDDDPEHFHPARCTGIGRPVRHVRLLSSRVIFEVFIHDCNSLSIHSVIFKSKCLHIVVMYTGLMPKLWNETIEAHRAAVRDAILETTVALVAEHGLRSVTMSRIAEEAGIGRATLYKYFPDVEAILLAWHERHVAGHLEHLAELREGAGDARERLEAVLEAYALIQHKRRATELAALLHRDEHVAEAQQHLTDIIRDLLTEATGTGDVRGDIAPDELASYCLHALAAASSLPSEAAVRRLVAVVLAGLRPPR
jgi:AcrR family transcriptional regulator